MTREKTDMSPTAAQVIQAQRMFNELLALADRQGVQNLIESGHVLRAMSEGWLKPSTATRSYMMGFTMPDSRHLWAVEVGIGRQVKCLNEAMNIIKRDYPDLRPGTLDEFRAFLGTHERYISNRISQRLQFIVPGTVDWKGNNLVVPIFDQRGLGEDFAAGDRDQNDRFFCIETPKEAAHGIR